VPATGRKTPEQGTFRRALVEVKGLWVELCGVSLDLCLIEYIRHRWRSAVRLSDRRTHADRRGRIDAVGLAVYGLAMLGTVAAGVWFKPLNLMSRIFDRGADVIAAGRE
jgi:hypothetical protein